MGEVIYVPIIHMSADLGSIAKQVDKRGILDLGGEVWEKHMETVKSFWDAISHYFDSIDVSGMKIYQDGMVTDGEVGQKIVEQGIKAGSKNYELVLGLLKRGAILVKTEDFKLVREERDRLLAITEEKPVIQKLISFVKYKLVKNRLLNKRDKFIAKSIEETLKDNERGILFIGAYHNIKKRLPKDIQIKQIKDTAKVREYQRLLPFYNKNKERFEELGRYLVSEIKNVSKNGVSSIFDSLK
jgi:hypothetical protein